MPVIDYYREEAERWLTAIDRMPLPALLQKASELRDHGHRDRISFSRKVFVPLTRLCRDVCGYCTFAKSPRERSAPFLTITEVLEIARAGQAAGCKEVLFTLGDKPELRYAVARRALEDMGFASTVEYLAHACEKVLSETGMPPHVNAGVMSADEVAALRRVSVSQGIMLESISERLCERGGPHFGAPDKLPQVRLDMLEAAGRLNVPFTSGILIGIGETRLEIVAALIALRDAHSRYGHLQEVIVQNFVSKPDTKMKDRLHASHELLMWSAAAARLILGPNMNIQAPPNLSFDRYPELLAAGINDWGGISPVTPDHVNPEAPWPQIERLRHATAERGYTLVERLAAYPDYVGNYHLWAAPEVAKHMLALADAEGFARTENWAPGRREEPPVDLNGPQRLARQPSFDGLIGKVVSGARLDAGEIVELFSARGEDVDYIAHAADSLRKATVGDVVRYVVNRNINYTNICTYRCKFCAFSKGKSHEDLRGKPYNLSYDEIQRRAVEAWDRGATEVCMQGGIHPDYTGNTYLSILRAVKDAVPDMHVHAFSPLEVVQGASTLGISVPAFLEKLQKDGLGSLPGTAAEILDDQVRAVICPDKLTTNEWLTTISSAHRIGLPTTSTIMFGHVETPYSWAKHLLAIRDLQEQTGGFTEFVPLPFVHMEAPISLRGQARHGPTWRETILMHSIARLVLHPLIRNIQASWVKAGRAGISQLLRMGVNDLGGTLMNESISKAAGTQHGQELPPPEMEKLILDCGRIPSQRNTLYGAANPLQRAKSFDAPELAPVVLTPLRSKSAGRVREYENEI